MAGVSHDVEEVRWNLSELCTSADEARAEWTELVARATAFADRYRGRIAALDAAGLRQLLDECDVLEQDAARLYVYGSSRVNMDATDVEANDLATFARDRGADIENQLVFVDLEWIALDDEPAETLLASPELAGYAHKLRTLRDEKPYVLSEAEEQALNARTPAVSSWSSAARPPDRDARDPVRRGRRRRAALRERAPLVHVPAGARAAPRRARGAVRRARAAHGRAGGLLRRARRRPARARPRARLRRSDAADEHAQRARRRPRRGDDGRDEESYALGRRWFEAKAGLLGLDRLELADQYAPVGEGRDVPVAGGGRDRRRRRSRGFSPRLAEIFRELPRARPRRRGAAHRQGERRVLHDRLEGDPAATSC